MFDQRTLDLMKASVMNKVNEAKRAARANPCDATRADLHAAWQAYYFHKAAVAHIQAQLLAIADMDNAIGATGNVINMPQQVAA